MPIKEAEMNSAYRKLAIYNHPDKLRGIDPEAILIKKINNAKDFFSKHLSFLDKNYNCEPDQLINRPPPTQTEPPKNRTNFFKESVQEVRENVKEVVQTENTAEKPLGLKL